MWASARIICISDACAGTTPDRHKAALAVMGSCFIDSWTWNETLAEYGLPLNEAIAQVDANA